MSQKEEGNNQKTEILLHWSEVLETNILREQKEKEKKKKRNTKPFCYCLRHP